MINCVDSCSLLEHLQCLPWWVRFEALLRNISNTSSDFTPKPLHPLLLIWWSKVPVLVFPTHLTMSSSWWVSGTSPFSYSLLWEVLQYLAYKTENHSAVLIPGLFKLRVGSEWCDFHCGLIDFGSLCSHPQVFQKLNLILAFWLKRKKKIKYILKKAAATCL